MPFYCVLLIAFFCSVANAQNWQPLNTQDKYNYQLDTAELITNTLWVDSVTIDNGDSVFHLNRILFICDTCTGYGAIRNYPQFLQQRMIKVDEGHYNFREHGNFTLLTQAAINDTFLFDTTLNISATVADVNDTMIWGITDSVKTYTLSNNETLLLSKGHGILHFPLPTDSLNNYSLVGIEGDRELGEQVPNFWDFYDFQVGDIFQYDSWDVNSEGGIASLEKFEIISKNIINDTVCYDIDGRIKGTTYSNQYGTNSWHASISESRCFYDSTNHIANLYPNQELMFVLGQYTNGFYMPTSCVQNYLLDGNYLQPTDGDTIYTSSKLIIDNQNGVTKNLIISQACSTNNCMLHPAYISVNSDTLIMVSSFLGAFTEIYKLNLGLFRRNRSACFEGETGTQLSAYQTSEDTFGTLAPDWMFTSLNEVGEPLYQLHPNPFTSNLTVSFPQHFEGSIILYALDGKQVYQSAISGTTISQNLEELQAGIYILEVSDGQQTVRQKLVKMW